MPDNNSRPMKRARTEEKPSLSPGDTAAAGPSQESVPKRDHQYWLEDGNIVLLAGQTAFRIYKTLLARQSVVFRDMFVASDPNSGPTFDGCPAVSLADSPEDLRALFQALLPVERRHVYWDRHRYTFDELYAMVRLGNKYQITDVQDQALALLKAHYTSRFDTWEKVTTSRADLGALPSLPKANPIGVVLLARLLDEPSMLPVAFYCCAALGSSVLDGWTRHDGTVEYLSLADTKRAVAGYGDLSHDCMPMVERIFDPTPSSVCMSPTWCGGVLRNVHNMAKYQGQRHDIGAILQSWSGWIRDELEKNRACVHCERGLYEREKTERRKLWCDLPDIFDLVIEGWEAS